MLTMKVKRHAKTARYDRNGESCFNELNGKPATVGEIAQNTYLSRERCQLILTQLVMAGLADYQFGCYRRLQQ